VFELQNYQYIYCILYTQVPCFTSTGVVVGVSLTKEQADQVREYKKQVIVKFEEVKATVTGGSQ